MALQKYFIAIVPPQPVLGEVLAIKQYIASQYLSRGALRSPAHITLHMPFEYEEDKEERLTNCLGLFKSGNAVPIELKDYGCFAPRVIFVDVIANDPLRQLQRDLVEHVKIRLHLLNQAQSLRGFHPHLTVAFRDLKKPQFYKAWEEFRERPFAAHFTCKSICLLKLSDTGWSVHREFQFT